MNYPHLPRILLMDDDRSFTRILSRLAERQNIPLASCHDIDELKALPPQGFDVAVLDYDLGRVDGLRIAGLVEELQGSIPIVLATHCAEIEIGSWPPCISRFVHKSIGPMGILGAAFEAYWKDKLERGLDAFADAKM